MALFVMGYCGRDGKKVRGRRQQYVFVSFITHQQVCFQGHLKLTACLISSRDSLLPLCVFVDDEHTLMFIHAHKYVLNSCLREDSRRYNTVYSSVFLQLPKNHTSAQNQPSGCTSAKGNPFWSERLKLKLALIKMAVETEGAFRPNF